MQNARGQNIIDAVCDLKLDWQISPKNYLALHQESQGTESIAVGINGTVGATLGRTELKVAITVGSQGKQIITSSSIEIVSPLHFKGLPHAEHKALIILLPPNSGYKISTSRKSNVRRQPSE